MTVWIVRRAVDDSTEIIFGSRDDAVRYASKDTNAYKIESWQVSSYDTGGCIIPVK